MLSVHTTNHIPQSQLDAYLEAFRPAWEGLTQEPNCRFFDLFSALDPTDSNIEILRSVQVWDDTSEEWIKNELTHKPYVLPFLESTKHMLVRRSPAEVFERKEGWCAVRSEYLQTSKKFLSLQLTIHVNKTKTAECLGLLRQSWQGITGLPELLYIDLFMTKDPNDEKVEILRLSEAWDCAPEFLMSDELAEKYDKPYFEAAREGGMLAKDRETQVFYRRDGWLKVRDEYLADAKR